MKELISLIFFFSWVSLYSQEKIVKGKITDQNNQPVAYASIGIIGSAFGTIADAEGDFTFYLPAQIAKTDTLKISCIGFASSQYPALSISTILNVTLTSQSTGLPEILVKSTKTKIKTVGNKREETFLNCNFSIGDKPNQNLGSEIGRKFFFKGKKHYINKLNIYSAQNFDTVLLRLNIYKLHKGLPDSALLTENIIITLTGPKRGWTSFDLKDHHLVYDQNIVVALQWIGHSKRGKILQMPITMPATGSVHFYKFGSQAKWKRFNNMSTSINLEVEVEE